MKINNHNKTNFFLPLLVAITGLTLTPTLGFIPPTLAQRALDFATQGCRGVPQEAYFMTQNYHINICRGQGGLFMVVSFRNEQLFDRFPVQAQGNSYVGTSQKASYQVNPTTFIIQPHNNSRPMTETGIKNARKSRKSSAPRVNSYWNSYLPSKNCVTAKCHSYC
ncbi:MAG: hypothetical protein RSE13_08525 [Planktothrix sp. GU0601_MAG3]|nr:MAG: hypothetical protein RSE13_08525 [Planktothrix sp. GU0601_MAG3]